MRKFVEIGGKRYSWRDVLRMRREQADAEEPKQRTLFPLLDDARPASQRSAAGRFEEPTLFKVD